MPTATMSLDRQGRISCSRTEVFGVQVCRESGLREVERGEPLPCPGRPGVLPNATAQDPTDKAAKNGRFVGRHGLALSDLGRGLPR